MKIVSTKIRRSAKGEECTLRLTGICNHNPETTVLAHVPCGHRGMGIKGPDTVACYACSSCHDVIDGRAPGEFEVSDLLRAVAETHFRLISRGLLKVAA